MQIWDALYLQSTDLRSRVELFDYLQMQIYLTYMLYVEDGKKNALQGFRVLTNLNTGHAN